MSCGPACDPSSHFPNPNDRSSGGPVPFNAAALRHRGVSRRTRFFSSRLQRASDVLQQPTTITFRELALLAVTLYALYMGYFAGDGIYTVLARRDVSRVCVGATAMQCLRLHIWQVMWIAGAWAGDVGVWLLATAVAVFFAEEAYAKARSLLGSR